MITVAELRNYLLKPGTRDSFIEYFKEHFVASQQALGATIPGLFHIKDEADRFLWIRGFDSMKDRSRFLPKFYGGEIWKEWGPAANDMMLEWHNVHLIKPLSSDKNSFPGEMDFFVIDFYRARDNRLTDLIELFNTEYIPVFNKWNITTSLWVSEMQENDFPRLPVHQDENLLVIITGYNSELEYESTLAKFQTSCKEFTACVNEMVQDKTSLVLSPTAIEH